METLTEDKDLINHIFLTCGAPEFAFIKRSGFYFGFLFGLLQMTAWIFYTEAWILPVFGFIVGKSRKLPLLTPSVCIQAKYEVQGGLQTMLH